MKNSIARLLTFALASLLFVSCGGDSQKLVGRWQKTKDVLQDGTVIDQNSPYNYYKNYTVDFRSDGKVFIEYDSDLSQGQTKHHQNKGEWKLAKGDSTGIPYLLTVRIIAGEETRVSLNRIITLSDKELVFISQDKHTVHFTRK